MSSTPVLNPALEWIPNTDLTGHHWKPGQSGNPKGRPLGPGGKHAKKHTIETLVRFAKFMADEYTYPDLDVERVSPATALLLKFANNAAIPAALRIAAATAASKVEPQFLYTKVDIPKFEKIEDAEKFKHELSQREARHEIDVKTARVIHERVQDWIDNQRADEVALRAQQELDYKLYPPAQRDHTVEIVGGLPSLPGTNIDMSSTKLNGHSTQIIEHQAQEYATGSGDAEATKPEVVVSEKTS